MSSSQECVAVLQRLLDECTLPCCFVLDADERAALTAAIDALQRQGWPAIVQVRGRAKRQSGEWGEWGQWHESSDQVVDNITTTGRLADGFYEVRYLYALPPQPPTGEQK